VHGSGFKARRPPVGQGIRIEISIWDPDDKTPSTIAMNAIPPVPLSIGSQVVADRGDAICESHPRALSILCARPGETGPEPSPCLLIVVY
jgi:hypothetical protein